MLTGGSQGVCGVTPNSKITSNSVFEHKNVRSFRGDTIVFKDVTKWIMLPLSRFCFYTTKWKLYGELAEISDQKLKVQSISDNDKQGTAKNQAKKKYIN